MSLDRRSFLLGATSLVAVGACSESSGDAAPPTGTTTEAAGATTVAPTTSVASPQSVGLAPPGSAGLVDEAYFQARVEEYLQFAGATLRSSSASGVAVQLARARRDPDYE